ncbi:RadC family protein [Clostridium intestinale]|uniref:DNA replication and repair protein RadC n=1 Tax=Clostridium intestinale DSM 6191 TaxID=1121320 RepID=A0A1M5XI45_9CLOT|nr:DNA repair protein RadC [Clostridium intestinale]SHH99194.1 DNA replication and repair protein RadC [Clostridium intestinale DSM 6191]
MYNLKVMDLPLNERPEEKLFLYGAESLSNTELIALILRCGSKNENVLGLSSRVLETVDGLNGMLSAGIQDFLQINGIKKAKASRLIALCELTKRINSYRGTAEEIKITEPRIVANILMNEMQNLPQEVLKLIILNTKNVVISIKEVFKGSLNSSIVHPREIFSEALKKNAASIIICHNHPSGDPTPSKEDINITLRIKECGKIIGIELLDHVIIGNGNYASMKEKSII